MKKIHLATFLVLTGAGFYSQSARATTLTYSAGDLLMGFRDTAATANVFVLDIGQASLYTKDNGSTIVIGTYGTTLNANFTDGFYTGNTAWGVASIAVTGDPTNTLYAGAPEEPNGDKGDINNAPVDPTGSGNAQNTAGSKIAAAGAFAATSAAGNDGGSAVGTNGAWESTAGSPNSTSNWAYSMTNGGAPFGGYFSNGFEGDINNDGANGGTILDFWKLLPSGGTETYEGSFTISSTGLITYQTAGTVPEPSTWTALAGGAGLLGLLRRRRAVAV